jgi:CRP-like cAMP-binding protein
MRNLPDSVRILERRLSTAPVDASASFNTAHLTLVCNSNGGHDRSALTSFFNEICPLSEEAISTIHEWTWAVLFKKGQLLRAQSTKNDHLYFILKGVVRGYTKQHGKDTTMWINADHEMVGSIPSLGILLPTNQHLQAIEDSTLVRIPQKLIEYLYEHFPEASLIGRALIEDHNRCNTDRACIRRIFSPEEKFKRFNETLPSLLDRIPLRYIASYLAITQRTLSRLRRGGS